MADVVTAARVYLVAAGALAVAGLVSAAADAGGPICGAYTRLAAELDRYFGEAPIFRWPTAGGAHVAEFWYSAEGRTFSILARDTAGRGCVISSGHHVEPVAAPAPGERGAELEGAP